MAEAGKSKKESVLLLTHLLEACFRSFVVTLIAAFVEGWAIRQT
jgi:hypothetical protein